MIKSIAYGLNNNGTCFVQSCCSLEHNGENCECKSFGENYSKTQAKKLAKNLAIKYSVPLNKW